MKTSLSGHQRPHRGASDEWYTPPEIFDALDIDFDLDPCSPLSGPVPWIPAQRFYTIQDDGLIADWSIDRVWLNPPYGPETRRWLGRLAHHGCGVALVPARTDTAWFHDYATMASAICLLRGRPHFYRPDLTRAPYNSGAPIMLLGYGESCGHAVATCGLGSTVTVQERCSEEPQLRMAV